MYFQIKELILWPRNATFPPRRVPFALGKVNVISGASRTGKSAVIPIIDYCLGSATCSIPVNTIRDACSWFGVVISTKNGEKLFARREPGSQRSTDDMYILESRSIDEIPVNISKNTNADSVRRLLDELAGLSNLDFGLGDDTNGFDGRPSFRDLAAFTFQPQNIVANPDVLFFKANTYEHREKLRKIFPYILGAITPALMAKQHELRRIQTELRRKEKEWRGAKEISSQWLAELRSKISEAKELGLLKIETEGELSRDQMLSMLEEIVKRTDLTLAVSSTTISDAIKELNMLEAEEREVSRELTTLRHRYVEMSRIQKSASTYHDALRIQRDRLQISDWLISHKDGEENCPVCGSGMDGANQKLEELHLALKNLEDTSGINVEIPAAFERELQRVQAEVSTTTDRLKAVQLRKAALSSRSQEAQGRQFVAQKAERFVGNLENALNLHRLLGDDSDLASEISKLQTRERELLSDLKNYNIDAQKQRALQAVNLKAAKLLPYLDAERPDDPISLEINDLTVKVAGKSRDDYLSEIGSGSNWLSYHIAILLGLQQYFLSLEHSSVPSFLILDQPSQVYFPKKMTVRDSDPIDEPSIPDEDVDAVRKAFRVMGSVVRAAQGKLQIIVLDHAPSDIWEQFSNVVGMEEWRDGVKLVPAEWLE
ncbi:DUF3732 domain-containing protein [Herbaspirillum lusitanum]|uniref:DUF3732 domain-containing protein n=1 Tax=Herbaspirillum lusitanum TaxID=213312 RepID=UPI0002D80209|nr:DUF3732 domain-containing protein [Herbaspirillum lusitanum]